MALGNKGIRLNRQTLNPRLVDRSTYTQSAPSCRPSKKARLSGLGLKASHQKSQARSPRLPRPSAHPIRHGPIVESLISKAAGAGGASETLRNRKTVYPGFHNTRSESLTRTPKAKPWTRNSNLQTPSPGTKAEGKTPQTHKTTKSTQEIPKLQCPESHFT